MVPAGRGSAWREESCRGYLEEWQHRTWHLEDVALRGIGTYRQQRGGERCSLGTAPWGDGTWREHHHGAQHLWGAVLWGATLLGSGTWRERERMAAGSGTAVRNGEMGRALWVVVLMGVRTSGGKFEEVMVLQWLW